MFLSEFFDDFEFTDDILEDDDDVVMFKKARVFFRYNHILDSKLQHVYNGGNPDATMQGVKSLLFKSFWLVFNLLVGQHLKVQCCRCRQHKDASKRTQNYRW